jgi:hypothetical protein
MIVRSIVVVLAAAALTGSAAAAPTGYFGPPTPGAERVICEIFGPYCRQALAVVRCESRFSTSSANGQYIGLFQMGSWERRKYGHAYGATIAAVYGQVRAAYRYFVASGKDWSPWECKPW